MAPAARMPPVSYSHPTQFAAQKRFVPNHSAASTRISQSRPGSPIDHGTDVDRGTPMNEGACAERSPASCWTALLRAPRREAGLVSTLRPSENGVARL